MKIDEFQKALADRYFDICDVESKGPLRDMMSCLHCKEYHSYSNNDWLRLYSVAEAIGAIHIVRERFSSYKRAKTTYTKALIAQNAVEKITDKNAVFFDPQTRNRLTAQQGGRFFRFLHRIFFFQPLETLPEIKTT